MVFKHTACLGSFGIRDSDPFHLVILRYLGLQFRFGTFRNFGVSCIENLFVILQISSLGYRVFLSFILGCLILYRPNHASNMA